jgi:hypothetical protein
LIRSVNKNNFLSEIKIMLRKNFIKFWHNKFY